MRSSRFIIGSIVRLVRRWQARMVSGASRTHTHTPGAGAAGGCHQAWQQQAESLSASAGGSRSCTWWSTCRGGALGCAL
eukprot:COSAG01_NODE_1735_length_9365_cov_3.816318_4_plen_79_part_00